MNLGSSPSEFLTPLVTQAHTAPGEFVVYRPLYYFSETHGLVTVERGFITDLASIPWAVQCLPSFKPTGLSRKPAVLHDFLYCTQPYPRAVCDALFHQALLAEGVNPVAARLFHAGVRTGGWIYYNRQTKALRNPDQARRYHFVPDTYWSTGHERRVCAGPTDETPETVLVEQPAVARRVAFDVRRVDPGPGADADRSGGPELGSPHRA